MTIFDLAYTLNFARENGWTPTRRVAQGVESLQDARMHWESWGIDNYGRQIGQQDAHAIGEALRKAIRAIAREAAETPAKTVPGVWAGRNIGNLTLFAEFCRGGKFEIGGCAESDYWVAVASKT